MLITLAVIFAVALTGILAWYVTSMNSRPNPEAIERYTQGLDSLEENQSSGTHLSEPVLSANGTSIHDSIEKSMTENPPVEETPSEEVFSAVATSVEKAPEESVFPDNVKVISVGSVGSDEDYPSRYYVVIGSFGVNENAEKLVAALWDTYDTAQKLQPLKSGLIPVSLNDFASLDETLRYLKAHPEFESRYKGLWILYR